MELTIAPNGVLQINGARIAWKNFEGREGTYNRAGDRNFVLVIPDEELANILQNDKNDLGASWNVKIKPPRDEDDTPFIFLPVKVKFNGRGPTVYLISNGNRRKLDEETIGMLDRMDILNVDLDIAPSDGEAQGRPYRAAYLRSMEVVQDVDRFTARWAEEEYPEE